MALVSGLVLIAAAIALTLSRSPLVLAGTNSVEPTTVTASTAGPASACQHGEAIPQGTTAVRLWLEGNVKSRTHVAVLTGGRTVASGTREGGELGKVTTIAVGRIARKLRDAQLCFSFDRAVQAIAVLGEPARRGAPGATARMRVEYLRPGPSSWWSLIGVVAQRIGIGRAPEGSLVALLPLILMALAVLLVAWTIIRQLGRGRPGPAPPIAGAQATPPQSTSPPAAPAATSPRAAPALPHSLADTPEVIPVHSQRGDRTYRVRSSLRRIPAPAWACACVAILSAASWSILTPPFQAPDEPSHFAYAQILAETGALPKSGVSAYSPQETAVLADLNHQEIRFNQAIGTIATATQQRQLQHDLSLSLARVGPGAGVAASQPPLYYALQAIPYYLASGGTLLDQLALMRLLSALLAGFTAIFVFLFLREALPAVPYAWTVGGLCTALAPLVGFISGIVNPDALLCAVSAALFYCLARGFRRGLTLRLAIAIGALTATGFMTKLNFVGVAPGVFLALTLLARRAARTSGRAAWGRLATAVAIGVGPGCLYAAINLLSGHAAFGLLSTGISNTGAHRSSPLQELSYIWQFYLPRLPGMKDYFPGISMIRQVWFDKSVGLYGWLDTYFPEWVYTLALIPAGLIAALCGRELLRSRAALRSRVAELSAYGAIGAGLLVLFGADSYLESSAFAGAYSEPRYLLPLAVLFAAILALAARGAGRRWGPVVGVLLILLILAHDIFSQLLVVGRFYG
ncbi:MAG TPA: DUF2142 domain-containing protein [Solirubrobacteraceae bacterium]